MPLKKCKECGHAVAASARTCPSCGVRNPAKRFGLVHLASALVLLAIVSSVLLREEHGGSSGAAATAAEPPPIKGAVDQVSAEPVRPPETLEEARSRAALQVAAGLTQLDDGQYKLVLLIASEPREKPLLNFCEPYWQDAVIRQHSPNPDPRFRLSKVDTPACWGSVGDVIEVRYFNIEANAVRSFHVPQKSMDRYVWLWEQDRLVKP